MREAWVPILGFKVAEKRTGFLVEWAPFAVMCAGPYFDQPTFVGETAS